MKPHQTIITMLLLLGILSVVGSMIMQGASNYDVKPSDQLSNTLTGQNRTEYEESVEKLKKTSGGEEGYLAQFKVATAVFSVLKNSLGQTKAMMNSLASFLGIPAELAGTAITIVIVLIIFGGIYFLRNYRF